MTIKNFIIFICFNTVKFLLFPVFGYFKLFDFAVLVYPGTDKDISTYMPSNFLIKFAPIISIIGFIRNNKDKKNGIIFATKYYIKDIEKENKEKIIKIIKKYANILKVKKVALVGRLPKILFETDKSLFVEGKTGTVFTVIGAVKKTIQDLNLNSNKITIGVIGVGFIGKEVLENLKNMGFMSIIGFDIRIKKDILSNNIIETNNPEFLKKCDLLIILTANGDDINDLVINFKNKAIILDDTHPSISKNIIRKINIEKNGSVYKVAAAMKNTKIYPEIPGFKSEWIPGCIVETIVSSYTQDKWHNQDEFNNIAEKFGFYAISKKII